MKVVLETERLMLREFTIEDSKFIIELVNTHGWIEYIGDRNIKTDEQAIEYLQKGPLKSYEQNGFGLCMVELRNEKTPVGMCGIIRRENLENPDIGFAFLPEFFGKGLAFEIANATVIYAKERLRLPVIYAITVPANNGSINLLEKLGMKFIKVFSFPGNDEELVLYGNE